MCVCENCTQSTKCIANAECEAANKTCVCSTNYYQKNNACVRSKLYKHLFCVVVYSIFAYKVISNTHHTCVYMNLNDYLCV